MTKQEFEKLTGRQVTDAEMEEANAVYMAAGDADKVTFAEEWEERGLRGSAVVAELVRSAEALEARNSEYSRSQSDLMTRCARAEADRDKTLGELDKGRKEVGKLREEYAALLHEREGAILWLLSNDHEDLAESLYGRTEVTRVKCLQ